MIKNIVNLFIFSTSLTVPAVTGIYLKKHSENLKLFSHEQIELKKLRENSDIKYFEQISSSYNTIISSDNLNNYDSETIYTLQKSL